MGTPKSVYRDREPGKVSAPEITRLFATAKNVAQWRTEEAREAALEQLRRWLTPMVSSLDKPLGELIYAHERGLPANKTRIMALTDLPARTNKACAWLGLNRSGDWVVAEYAGKWKIVVLDGETLERMIWTWREKFLADDLRHLRRSYEEEVMNGAPVLEGFTRHACFLGFVRAVIAGASKHLKQREERLQTMRGTLNVLEYLNTALDPLSYSADLTLPGYSVFYTHPGHTSRSSSDYLVKGPVEQEVSKSNADKRLNEDTRYVVETAEYKISSSHTLLSRVADILKDAKEQRSFGSNSRAAFGKEEVAVLEAFVHKACTFDNLA